jgi:early secretory antigenic target protein ESAT-6
VSDGIIYNFAGIEGGAGEISGAVATTNGLLDEGKGSLATLQSVWGGGGSEAYQQVQMRWDATSADLNDALQKLAQAISEAGQQMASTEAGVTGMFGA